LGVKKTQKDDNQLLALVRYEDTDYELVPTPVLATENPIKVEIIHLKVFSFLIFS